LRSNKLIKVKKYIYDEYWAAGSLLSALISNAFLTRNLTVKLLISMAAPFGVGLCVAFWSDTLRWTFSSVEVIDVVISLAVAMLGLLIGVMIFTGYRPPGDMTLSQMKEFKSKLYFLYFSEIITFASTVILIIILFAQRIFIAQQKTDEAIIIGTFSFPIGMIMLSRFLLLPFSIFEIHQFVINEAIQQKTDVINKEIEDEVKELDGGHTPA